jgi:hypothetical protein
VIRWGLPCAGSCGWRGLAPIERGEPTARGGAATARGMTGIGSLKIGSGSLMNVLLSSIRGESPIYTGFCPEMGDVLRHFPAIALIREGSRMLETRRRA